MGANTAGSIIDRVDHAEGSAFFIFIVIELIIHAFNPAGLTCDVVGLARSTNNRHASSTFSESASRTLFETSSLVVEDVASAASTLGEDGDNQIADADLVDDAVISGWTHQEHESVAEGTGDTDD